jgi:rhodanese-related sulfurtransferase
MKRNFTVFMMIMFALVVMSSSLKVEAGDVPRMDKEELKAMLDKADVVIIDVRVGKDWTASESKIKGAVREVPKEIESWATKYQKDKTYVLYLRDPVKQPAPVRRGR